LNGAKLWCTNGTLADVIVVMARDPSTGRINCFVVETSWKGVIVERRCHFMGLRALANASLRFENVEIPSENLIGEEGRGLNIALTTLNTGRLSLPAATAGSVKALLEVCRKWSNARVQWGAPIGKHEAIAHKIADLCAAAYAMESVAETVGSLADREEVDIRLEAAAAKEWNTRMGYQAVDEALQIRGGRGYETERSLAARGEPPIGIERMLRDSRINLIFEGSSEIMHLFIAREAVDKHLSVAGALVEPKSTWQEKLRALPKIVLFYARWYPTLWIAFGFWPRFASWGSLGAHARFVERCSRRLGRALFHGMVIYRSRLERKQAFLFRVVDISLELFALTASISRARAANRSGGSTATEDSELCDLVAMNARRRVRTLFHELWHNDDARKVHLSRAALDGRFVALEDGIVPLGLDTEALKPPTVDELLAYGPLASRGDTANTLPTAPVASPVEDQGAVGMSYEEAEPVPRLGRPSRDPRPFRGAGCRSRAEGARRNVGEATSKTQWCRPVVSCRPRGPLLALAPSLHRLVGNERWTTHDFNRCSKASWSAAAIAWARSSRTEGWAWSGSPSTSIFSNRLRSNSFEASSWTMPSACSASSTRHALPHRSRAPTSSR
jgi:hypothetical protein